MWPTCHTPPWPAAWKVPCVDLEWQKLQLLDVLEQACVQPEAQVLLGYVA